MQKKNLAVVALLHPKIIPSDVLRLYSQVLLSFMPNENVFWFKLIKNWYLIIAVKYDFQIIGI